MYTCSSGPPSSFDSVLMIAESTCRPYAFRHTVMSRTPSPFWSGFCTSSCQHHRSSACAKRRLLTYEIAQLLEPLLAEQFQKRRGFAAWNNETLDVIELLRLTYQHNLGTEFFQSFLVGIKVAL